MPPWKRLLRLALLAMLTPVAFLLSCQSSLIYHPRPNEPGMTEALASNRGERITYRTSQGLQTAWYMPPHRGDETTAPLWIAFSGNGSLALDWLSFAGIADGRFAWLMIDYPGYGECEGNPTPKSIRQSSEKAFETLARRLKTTRQALAARSLVLGHSLGAAAALMAAEDLGLSRGVLISPFTSMTDMGRVVLGWPFCHLNLHRFDNRKTLGRMVARKGARVVIFHGAADEVIPVRMGRELAGAHAGAVDFHEVPVAHHNDILSFIAPELKDQMKQLAFPKAL